jgi:hypothetical protein
LIHIPNKRKIAFVFYPDAPGSARLETMPFAMHILGRLIASGWHVDIFVWDERGYSYEKTTLPEKVRCKSVKTYTNLGRLEPGELTVRFFRHVSYASVFSVGHKGSYVGGIISTMSRCPHILLNDEFPSCWGKSIWTSLERWSAHRADVIIIPSYDRETRLREELGLDSNKPFVTVRNTPELTEPLAMLDWHSRLGIPSGKRIFINAGSLGDWAQVPEILATVSFWPQDSVLLLHSKTSGESSRCRHQLSHLENPERIFWSSEPLSESMLHSLIRYCSGSFALYRNDSLNTELVGTSSGKLMRSIVCGTPVITSSFKSLDFVTREGVGIQVNHPVEISAAIDNLIRNRETYRTRCLSFSIGETSLRDEAWSRLVNYIKGSSKPLDLSSPSIVRNCARRPS